MSEKSLKKIDIVIIKYLYSNNFTLDCSFLKNILNISKSNIRLSINRINKYLIKISQGSCYIKKDCCYLNVNNSLKTVFTPLNTLIFSSKERQEYILADLIFKQNINLNDYIKLFDITRTTISSDIRRLKKFLNKHNLELKSIPFKGVFLVGHEKNKTIFSIKCIVKLLIEKDSDAFFQKIYNRYMDLETEKNLRFITKSVVEILENHFNITSEFYYLKSILAVIIYLSIFSKEGIKPLKISPVKEIENIFYQVKNILLETSFIKGLAFDENSINLVVYSFLDIFPEYSFRKGFLNNNKFIDFITELKTIFKIEIDSRQFVTMMKLLRFFEFKKEFYITTYNPKNLIECNSSLNLKVISLLEKYSINIFPEDFYSFSIFLKNITYKYKSILILDVNHDCWVGKIIKIQTQAEYPTSTIQLKNVSQCSAKNILESNPDFILYTGFNFSEFYPEIQIKNRAVFL